MVRNHHRFQTSPNRIIVSFTLGQPVGQSECFAFRQPLGVTFTKRERQPFEFGKPLGITISKSLGFAVCFAFTKRERKSIQFRKSQRFSICLAFC